MPEAVSEEQQRRLAAQTAGTSPPGAERYIAPPNLLAARLAPAVRPVLADLNWGWLPAEQPRDGEDEVPGLGSSACAASACTPTSCPAAATGPVSKEPSLCLSSEQTRREVAVFSCEARGSGYGRAVGGELWLGGRCQTAAGRQQRAASHRDVHRALRWGQQWAVFTCSEATERASQRAPQEKGSEEESTAHFASSLHGNPL